MLQLVGCPAVVYIRLTVCFLSMEKPFTVPSMPVYYIRVVFQQYINYNILEFKLQQIVTPIVSPSPVSTI